jgi:hypothetical protein
MWVLVFINMMYNLNAGDQEPVIEAWYQFDSMEQCFAGRENLLAEMVGTNVTYFPQGTQAVCIRVDSDA